MMKKTDLMDAFKELSSWTDATKGTVTMVRTDLESVFNGLLQSMARTLEFECLPLYHTSRR